MTDHACCSGFTASRRSLLKSALALGGGLATTQVFGDAVLQTSYAGTPGAAGNVLVVLSMRGGIDGLGTVIPHGDPAYALARPTTGVPYGALLQPDAMFGLHPALSPLEPYWVSGEMAAIHAVGLPAPNRSHFAAIEAIEDADPGSSMRSGWLNRMVGLDPAHGSLSGVQLGAGTASTAMSGDTPTFAAQNTNGLQLAGTGGNLSAQRYQSLDTAWAGTTTTIGDSVRETIRISQEFGSRLGTPAPSVTYPTSGSAAVLSSALQNVAALIKADVGTDAIAVDFGSFDLHARYGGVDSGLMRSQLDAFAGPLAAFLADLGDTRSRVTVLTISEFGRRLVENGNAGFDHGWGNVMFAVGAGVTGGRYYARWNGLDTIPTDDSDLAVTTDYRDVLAEVVGKRFPDRTLSTLFPGFTPTPVGFMA